MTSMRAVVVFAALLSFAFPGVSARAIELRSPISITLSIKAPGAPLPEIHRASGESDQLLKCGAVPPSYGIAGVAEYIDLAIDRAVDPPSVNRHCPPLAPRPPPL